MTPLIGNLLFPPVCVGCREIVRIPDHLREAPYLCPDCAEKWKRETEELCGICQQPVGQCTCVTDAMAAAHIPLFRKAVYYRHGTRDPIQNRMVYRIKSAPDRRTVRFFAEQLAPAVREILAMNGWQSGDCALVWLPRSRENRLSSGTDQARALAKTLSNLTGIPAIGLLGRVPRADREQKELSPAERKKNAANAFRVQPRQAFPTSTHLFLVDDIVTIGASMAAAAKLLRHAKYTDVVALAALSDDANRTTTEKQPVIDIRKQR